MMNKYKVSENRLSIMEIERFAVHGRPGHPDRRFPSRLSPTLFMVLQSGIPEKETASAPYQE